MTRRQYCVWSSQRELQIQSTWKSLSLKRSSVEWNVGSSRSPVHKGSHCALHPYQSSPHPNWWWTAHHKSLPAHKKSCQLENPKKKNRCFPKWHYNIIALVAIYTLNRCCRARKPACEEQNDRTSPMSGRLLVEDRSSCRCSWTKDWYSDRQPSISLPFTHPRSNRPSSRRPNKWSGAWSSPPMMIAGQKQLKPCPIFERAATVESTEVVNCSKKLRASRWNSRLKYELPILLRAANTRVPIRTPHQELGETWNDWATHTHPTVPQAAAMIPVSLSAVDSRWTEPVHQTSGTRSHLLSDTGRNYLQLKQKHVS